MKMLPHWEAYCFWRDAFGEVMDERYYTLDWLDLQVLNGELQFWATPGGAIIAELKEYPTGAKDVHGLVAAGDLSEIIEVLIPQALKWGREQGCIAGLIESKTAWVKLLKPHGWEAHQTIVRKEL